MAMHELHKGVAEIGEDDLYILLVAKADGNAFIVANADGDEAIDFMNETIILIENGLLGDAVVSARPS